MTMEDFGKRIGISKSYVNGIEKDRDIPDDRIFVLIEKEFGYSRHWLKTGEGPMHVNPSDPLNELSPDDRRLFERLMKFSLVPDEAKEEVRQLLVVAVSMIERRINQDQEAKSTAPAKRGA